jgi:hypothetical protein
VTDYETITSYTLTSPGRVTGRQRTAVYLDPRHPAYFKVSLALTVGLTVDVRSACCVGRCPPCNSLTTASLSLSSWPHTTCRPMEEQ